MLIAVSIAASGFFLVSRLRNARVFSGSLLAAIVLTASIPAWTFYQSLTLWQDNSSESYYQALKDMSSRLPKDCIVMGRMACFLSLVHPCKAYWTAYALNGVNPAPDFLLLNRGESELVEWEKTNSRVRGLLANGWDNSFQPLAYNIMGNYYSHQNTVLIKPATKQETGLASILDTAKTR
jgi:hypothetical protein